jgi:hypothetical protein
MLFTQHNGLAQALGDDGISQLQELACGLGPQVDGVIASVVQPQSMGAFSTQGAMNACMMRGQQAEQHQPTTTTRRGFGDAFGAVNTALIKAVSMPYTEMKLMTSALPQQAAQPQPIDPYGPATPLPTTTSYPAGTITAFSSSTNMWRVAVPTVAAGLGMFGAAAAFTEIAPVAAPPAGATQVSESQLAKQTGQLPIWKKWQFWAAIGGGVAVIGTSTALLFRRKRVA